MNVFNSKPLTWCIYRFCTDVTNKSASMIFFFFKSRDISHRRKSVLATDLKTAYRGLILTTDTDADFSLTLAEDLL